MLIVMSKALLAARRARHPERGGSSRLSSLVRILSIMLRRAPDIFLCPEAELTPLCSVLFVDFMSFEK
jgi:hypothetical protein